MTEISYHFFSFEGRKSPGFKNKMPKIGNDFKFNLSSPISYKKLVI